MRTIFYKRSGERTSRAHVRKQQEWLVNAKRYGSSDPIPMSKQPAVADSIERMTEEQFCDWSGSYTFRKL